MRGRNQTIKQSFRIRTVAVITGLMIATFGTVALAAPSEDAPGAETAAPTSAAAAASSTTGLKVASRVADAPFDPDSAPTGTVVDGLSLNPVPPVKPPNDLLERLRNNFALEWTMNPRIESELDWFVRHPAYLDRVFTRAQRFLPYIADELERRDMPLEIALLPVVESAFDPFAYSHGRAAGLWQIIPGTGRRFGIEQNWWYDGRRDILDSTRGALDYLTALHDMMDGDWLLAVASYNSGEGNVRRGVRRNLRLGRPTDFWHISVPAETRTYVPRLLALVAIVRDPAAYDLTLPRVVEEPQFDVVETGSQIDLALAAEIAGVDIDTVYSYNPGYNQWATDPNGPHRLVLPAGLGATFSASLDQVPVDQRMRWKRHKIESGQTLSQIADQYNTTIDQVRAANNLSGHIIRAGSYLMVPVATEPLTKYVKSADARRSKIQSVARSGNKVEHVVARGESFWSISRRYGVGTTELAKWNAMAPRDTLSIGQTLVVWTDSAPASGPQSKNLTRKLSYTVRKGDSLYLIASRFRVSVGDLLRWNSIDKSKYLQPGQSLTMYVNVTEQSS